MKFGTLLLAVCLSFMCLSAHAVRAGKAIDNDDSAWTYTVRILAKSGTVIAERCTGTLIDRRIILTAAHCFKGPYKIDKATIIFGKNKSDPQTYTAESALFVVHDNYVSITDPKPSEPVSAGQSPMLNIDGIKTLKVDEDFYLNELEGFLFGSIKELKQISIGFEDHQHPIPQNDLALIFLDSDVPSTYKPIRFARDLAFRFMLPVQGYGFGLYGIGMHQFDDQLRGTIAGESIVTGFAQDQKGLSHFVTFSLGKANVCIGDSGGPAVVERWDENHNKHLELAGILSAVGNGCYGYAYYAIPHYNLEWIYLKAQEYLGRIPEV